MLFTQEATYILFKQLDRLGTVEKLLKKQGKEEANVEAMKRMTEKFSKSMKRTTQIFY